MKRSHSTKNPGGHPDLIDEEGDGNLKPRIAHTSHQQANTNHSFAHVVNGRISCRSFAATPVPYETLLSAFRLARQAPSAGNLQAYQIVVVEGTQQKSLIAHAAFDQDWIATAPVVLVFLADLERSGCKYGHRGRHLYSIQDATIAATYTQLALADAGLESCWVGAFDEAAVAEVVGVGSRGSSPIGTLRPVVVMPLGQADSNARKRRHHRRDIRAFVHHGSIRPHS